MNDTREIMDLVCADLKDTFLTSMEKHAGSDLIHSGLFYMVLGAFVGEVLMTLYNIQSLSKEQMDTATVEFCEVLKDGIIKFSMGRTVQ